MSLIRPWSRVTGRSAAGALLAISLGAHPFAASAQQGGESFERWAAAHALPIQTVEPGSDAADLRRLSPLIGAARVVAFGEPAHGVHEPLAFRNRLFRYLVEELGFTAIVLESGLPESRPIDHFVAGAPGDAGQIVRGNLNFGEFRENEDLVRWMREYNADPAHRRKIRFYGMDLSLGGPIGTTPKPAALDAALSYLVRVDSMSAQRIRETLQPLLARLPGMVSAASFSQAEQDALSATMDDLIALLERGRPGFIAATSEADYEWGHRNAVVALQTVRLFRLVPPELADGPPKRVAGGFPPEVRRVLSARDTAMAENVRWVLAQEGQAGRVLVFAHNGHVMNDGHATGRYLRSALGDDLVIIGSSSAGSASWLSAGPPDPGSVDAALARVGLPRFLLDLRAPGTGQAVTAWLAEPRALRSNFTTYMTQAPGVAFDALLYLDTLTPAHTAPPPR